MRDAKDCCEALASYLLTERLQILGTTQSNFGLLVLIGPDEPSFWDHFVQSPEYKDELDHALDRWSRRVLSNIADATGGVPRFPFGGAPFDPFYTWALESGRFWASPIGFLVHDTAGLFASFRGAVAFSDTSKAPAPASAKQPCFDCTAKPCATACPVDAFANGYDVAACKAHLARPEGRDCITRGCRARRACPIGQGRRLPAQAAFHMEAFV